MQRKANRFALGQVKLHLKIIDKQIWHTAQRFVYALGNGIAVGYIFKHKQAIARFVDGFGAAATVCGCSLAESDTMSGWAL